MILGVGIDIIEVDRIKKAYERWGRDFLNRVFTESEIDYCLRKRNPHPSLAARFAAKEAGFKAFSQSGIRISSWRDLWVENDPEGRPTLRAKAKGQARIHLSLSHTKGSSIALVIVEEGER